MKKITFLVSFLLALLSFSTFAQNYSFEKWFNGKKSATVLTFDDWSPGQGPIGVAGLNSRGLVGSFYITINNVSDWQPIRNAAAAGHEIGNHTRTHPYLSQVSATQLVDEVTTSRAYIESQLPGVKIQTLVYPHGDYNAAVIAETKKNHFSARAYIEPMLPNQTFPYNFATTQNDYYTLNTVPVDVNTTPTVFGNWVQQAINSNGLLTFTFHSLNNATVSDSWWDPITETQYLSLLDKLLTYQTQTWITTYANAVKYHKEVNSATLTTVSNTADFWTLSLTDTVNNAIFNQPLTIKLKKVAGDTYSSISQNGVNIPFTTTVNNDSIVFNAIPDGGNILINKTGVAVTLNSPVNNATFTGLNPIALSATATVVGTTVSSVTFTVNGQTITATGSNPYTASWTPTTYGSFTVTATVNAANGKTAVASSSIAVNQQPVCTDPAWNATTAYTGNTKVSYNNRKYTANWWNQNTRPDLNSGSGQAWTDNGPCGSGSNIAPTVSLTAPTVLTYTATATVSIAADAADSDGSISKVEFYNGSTLLNTDNTAPYAYTWTVSTPGTYVITAKAYDNSTGVTTSASKTITVNPAGNVAPTVSLTAPTVLTYTATATVSIAADAADSDGSISKVEFYNGSILLNTDNTSPYTYTWTVATPGTYVITAKAYDNSTGVTTSASKTITVNPAGNVAPTVSLTAPTVFTYTETATVSIAADAADSDGSISKVEFYNGSTLLNTDNTAPYAYTWTGVTAGTYVITAKAYDNSTGVTTSASKTITVNPANGACTAPAYVATQAYNTNDVVVYNGIKYKANWWTQNQQPDLNSGATGSGKPWTSLGTCTSRTAEEEVLATTSIYPNPTSGAFTIDSKTDAAAHVFNAYGNEVAVLNLVDGRNEINLSVAAGIYYIRVNNTVTKLVVE